MALPLAPYNAGLISLLPYCHLHHVQLATATLRLFDVYGHFALTASLCDESLTVDDFTVGHPAVSRRVRRLWDRGKDIDVHPTKNRSFAMARRLIWDPGIASCAIVGAMGMPVYFEVFRRRPPVLLHASIGSMSSCGDRDCHDGLLLCHASVFHCCHPVLSRPAVPNVDS